MDFKLPSQIWFGLMVTAVGAFMADPASGKPPVIQFDMPAVVPAVDTTCGGSAQHVTVDLVLSSLVLDPSDDDMDSTPPIEHLVVRCALRDGFPVTDYQPKTELQSDFASPISISKKDEQSDSFGLNLNGNAPPYGGGHLGADDSQKRLDAKEYQRHAPMQAVVASGTTDRGHGVYFKFRWTAVQVLEGEKHFQVTFVVPQPWRGGLIDVEVTATGLDRPLFGSPKLKKVASRQFVIAVHREHDLAAANIAMRLAELDRKLAHFAIEHPASTTHSLADFVRRLLPKDSASRSTPAGWYHRVIGDQADPYIDDQIRDLPMPVRVAVLSYVDTARELTQLSDAS